MMRDTARSLARHTMTALIFVTFPVWFIPFSVYWFGRTTWLVSREFASRLLDG